MESLLRKKVVVRELNYLCAVRDRAPEEIEYKGIVAKVSGHMIKLVDCRISQQVLSREDPGEIWFNTMASSFQSIKPV